MFGVGGFRRQLGNGIGPSFPLGGFLFVAALDPGFPGVAGAAEGLEIARVERQFRVRPDWLDVVDFQPPPLGALAALPAVPLKDLVPQHLPAAGGSHPL